MHKVLRETIAEIRHGGGTDVEVDHGGRHTVIKFTAEGERKGASDPCWQ